MREIQFDAMDRLAGENNYSAEIEDGIISIRLDEFDEEYFFEILEDKIDLISIEISGEESHGEDIDIGNVSSEIIRYAEYLSEI